MKLVCQTKLQFKEGNSDKVYEVDLCESGDRYLVNFRYGRRGTELKEGTKTNAPVGLAEAEKIFQKLVDEKTRKGYHVVGTSENKDEKPKPNAPKVFDEQARNNAILDRLKDAKAKSNPRIERIIWRAGELKIKEAAPYIVNLVGTAKELRDYCCAWSLGFCGNENDAIPALWKLKDHKAEFVQNIAHEAMHKILGKSARAEFVEKSLSKLPTSLQKFFHTGTTENTENFEAALREEISNQKTGALMILSHIYQLENRITRPALLKLLAEIPFKPRYFKAVRQIFKTAEYRRDAETFGIIAKRFETESAGFHISYWSDHIYRYDETTGNWSSFKISAELKKDNPRIAYSNKTKDYFRRRTWRTLRRLGEIGDADFVKMATGALLAYSDADARAPRVSTIYDYYHTGRWDWQNPKITEIHWDKFSPYLLFNHLLYENSPRYEHKTGSRGFRMKANHKTGEPAPAVREEAFPKLWEANPAGLLHLLSESRCEPVHEFAVKALRDCREFCDGLDLRAILMLLESPYEISNRLGFELAAARFDSLNPNVELVVAVAVCNFPEARAAAFRWIDARRELFAKNDSAILKLLTANHEDTRKFAAQILQSTNYDAAQAQRLIARLISELLALGETKQVIAADLSDAVFLSFGKNLRNLNLAVVGDLLSHPLVEAQILGANILVNHETGAENLPNDLIDSLIGSPFEQIRALGIKLFGQLPEENLLRRESAIISFLTHELADVHFAIRPTIARLAANHEQFRANLLTAIFIELLRAEKAEGVHLRLLETLREIPDWTRFADLETTKMLIEAESAQANEIGGLILQTRADEWYELVSTEEIIDFSNHEILAIRRSSWQIADRITDKLRAEVSLLIRALDSKWQDSREFWREYFRARFSEKELTPEILVAICDSVKAETQKFGRDLLLHYFHAENGVEYLIKLSEHPSAQMQFFATGYLENFAADSPEKFERLAPYFVRVLSLVNRSRAAKDRVLRFLEAEALKSEQAARVAAEILARQSATIAIGDKASMIETMLKIRRRFPEIDLPVKIKLIEVRTNVF